MLPDLSRLWPFEKKITEIPCGREAFLTGFISGPCIGGVVYMFLGHAKRSMQWGTNLGVLLIMLTFIPCRIKHEKNTFLVRRKEGGIDWKK